MRLNKSGLSPFGSEEIRICEDNKCFVSGAGRNSKNKLLSLKCPQAASLVVEEQEVVGGTPTVIQTATEMASFES